MIVGLGRIVLCAIFALATTSVVSPARAASFDCHKATTANEKAICANPALSKLDEKLSATYKSAMAKLPAEGQRDLKREQLAWLKRLGPHCDAPRDPVRAVPGYLARCLTDAYKAQIGNLESAVGHTHGHILLTISRQFHRALEANGMEDDDEKDCLDHHKPAPGHCSEMEENGYSDVNDSLVYAYPEPGVPDAFSKSTNQHLNGDAQDLDDYGSNGEVDGTESVICDDRGLMCQKHISGGHYYIGMTHPVYDNRSVYFLMKEERPMTLGDVFKAGRQKAAIEKMAKRVITIAKLDFPNPQAGLEAIIEVCSSLSNWKIESSGVTLALDPYQFIGSEADVSVEWTDLKGDLSGKFRDLFGIK
ncbi:MULTISPECIES: lysozyme inhibitor LprI family protein [Nitrospirillum]|uniref:Lysozyme inhibitor LprI-like N-terminal domain-containing protein n=1 Tax=Nitrospirillum amazonense TaxID=28077 RepID=A0A560FKV6_9PROT|nr:lysozyme inhibitor LprI family protein [Nitrospirillum amazonense]MEC4590849.1 lysozyme inhibitor LprI family protein [Nitrospirillum amazonense]TWB22232.1 uncharacterized protein FBZ88_11662 [Nitrospirillum amazonense]